MTRLLSSITVVAALAIPSVGGAEETLSAGLIESARRAGAEASPLIFERHTEANAEAGTDGRISGKTLLLATAIASAALVTAAWLLRGRCEPMDETVFVEFPRARAAYLPDGTPVAALPLFPAYPLPVLCQPRH